MFRVRRLRMGYVPQRPLHGARHQGAQRLRLGVFPDRARFLIKVDRVARYRGRAARTDQRGRQSLGSHRANGQRSRSWQPKTMLVTGAGPVGLLAALIGAQQGLDVHVLDHHETRKSDNRAATGRQVPLDTLADVGIEPDILMECSGAPSVVRDVLGRTAPAASFAWSASPSPVTTSMSTSARSIARWCSTTTPCSGPSTPTAGITKWPVRRYERRTRPGSNALISRREPVEQWTLSLRPQPDDIKVIVDFS